MAPRIILTDKPCGHGKTSELIERMPTLGKFLIISPLKSEVTRFVEGAAEKNVEVYAPTDEDNTKTSDLLRLLRENKSICTTHAMYLRLASIVRADKSILDGYTIIIDEVPTPVEPAPNIASKDFDLVLLNMDFIEIDPKTHQVRPTEKWEKLMVAGATRFYPETFKAAMSGRLYTQDGNLFILAIPVELISAGSRLEIMTYLSKGSLIRAYLEKIGASYEIDKLPEDVERSWRENIRDHITIESFPKPDGVSFSHSGQTERTNDQAGARVAKTIDNLFNRSWKGVKTRNTMITCAFENWHGNKKRGLAGIWAYAYGKWTKNKKDDFWSTDGLQWLANTTRGSNRWIKCTHLIYLYCQNPNPSVTSYLDVKGREFDDAFALTELVQWMFRSGIRKKKPDHITVAIPTERMRNLLINWLDRGIVSRDKPRPDHKCIVSAKVAPIKKRKLTRPKLVA
jgi:hypothetical protein